ncbi:interleukin-13 receptor subunit alpha-1 [Salminus brasiliensis]|uniref:interleukin-13 receptor subunit alpha-1 n=1 Tax=Salminus brasiliensis TaxID=930266 RepID=UPI003B831DE5
MMSCGHWDISLITCFFFMVSGVVALSDELPQPENLHLSWNSDRSVILQWSRPAGLDANCQVNYQIELYLEKCPPSGEPERKWRTIGLNHTWDIYTNEICFKILTIPSMCPNKTPSKPLFEGLSQHPDVVKNFTCVYYSRMKMNCTWSLTSESPDLQLFYNSGSGGSQNPCVSYIGSGLIRTGCHLHGEEFLNDSYHFLVNGTHNDAFFQNLFKIEPKQLVKIPPLKLNITTDQKRIYFQSSSPDFQPVCWVYHFYYTKCDEGEKSISGMDSRQSLEYDESCSYRGRVKAIYSSYCGKGESDISEPVYYGVNRDPNWTLKVALITPVIVSCCLIVALVLFRRHKDSIFPEIPAPPLLLKDVLNSNKDKVLEMGKLYVPYEDVVEKISLEPESTFHRCES